MTPKEDNKRLRRQIALQNKRRSASMERKIARELGGNRVPMSGAGSMKGDGIVYSDHGMYIIECKMTSKEKGTISFSYFEKLDRDAYAMRARFGVVIFHFFRSSHDYCFIREQYYHIFSEPVDFYYTYKTNGKAFSFDVETIEGYFGLSGQFVIECPMGRIIAFRLSEFKEKVKPVAYSI